MAKNLQESPLATSLDKISYIAAGVLALVILGMSMTGGKKLNELKTTLADGMQKVQARRDEKIALAPVPTIEKDLRAQWTAPAPSEFPEWTTARAPALMQATKDVVGPRVTHTPAKFTEISYHRDKKSYSVYLKVEGVLGQTEYGRFDSAKLFRSVDGGEFQEIRGFSGSSAIASGAISHEDRDVEFGKNYSYMVRTRVSKRPGAGADIVLAPEDVQRESAECGTTTPIPGDVWVRLAFAEGFNAESNTPGFMQGQIFYGSDEAGSEAIEVSSPTAGGRFDEDFVFGPLVTNRQGEKVKLFRIVSTDENKVTIRHALKRGKARDTEFTRDSDQIPLVLPGAVRCDTPAPAEPEEGVGADGSGEEPPAEPEEPAEPEGEAKDPEGDTEGGGVFK